MTEKWAEILGFEGSYRVSSEGRVYSIPRADALGRSRGGIYLKAAEAGGGHYLFVSLSLNGVVSQRYVHRLVLEAFAGPCPEGMEGRHLNGDNQDNRRSNLAWGTPKENSADKYVHGTVWGLNKTHCPWGHPLEAPNLVSGIDHRECLACSRARARMKRSSGEVTQELRDQCYSEIVERPGPRGSGQEFCKRMHLLAEPNLVRATLKDGWRQCLACNRGRSFAKNRGTPFTQELADHYYAQIMTTQTPAAPAA